MTFDSNHLLLGRLAIIPFALAEWAVVVWYLRVLPGYRDNFPKRLFALVVTVAVFLIVVFGQMDVYTMLTSVRDPINGDNFFFGIVLIQQIVSIFLSFYILIKRGRSNSTRS